jgi:ubiquinone/menaquinone biosynthesis C-methylase UbiE
MDNMRKAMVCGILLLGTGAVATWVLRERSRPSACPFGQRIFLDIPRPFLGRDALVRLLGPAPGERVLEVGPGTGYYTLEVARHLEPGGQIDAVDLQQAMLDEMMRRARARGLSNVVLVQGDAQRMPFPDATFDAAFLVATLGEVPDRDRALRELRRVLKPGGRLIVGEGQPDPHMVPLAALRRESGAAGLHYQHHEGGRLGYLVRFRTG